MMTTAAFVKTDGFGVVLTVTATLGELREIAKGLREAPFHSSRTDFARQIENVIEKVSQTVWADPS